MDTGAQYIRSGGYIRIYTHLYEIAKPATSITSLQKRATEIIRDEMRVNFSEGGRPHKWAPWSPATLKSYQKKKFVGNQILQHTEDLFWAATYGNARLSGFQQPSGVSSTILRWQIKYEPDLIERRLPIYSLAHLYGNSRPTGWQKKSKRRVYMPARPWNYVSPDTIIKIGKSIGELIIKNSMDSIPKAYR